MGVSPLAVLAAGILGGMTDKMAQNQAVSDYNKGLGALANYVNSNDPNSQAAQDAYMTKTYGSNPAYQSVSTRLDDVNKIMQDKMNWQTQNDAMTKAANDAAALRSQLGQESVDPQYLDQNLSASGLSGLLANADDATKSGLSSLLTYKTNYETAQQAREAAANQANSDRQAAIQAGVPTNLIGADVDLSKMASNPAAYMGGLGLTDAQTNQYLTDKANPGAALMRSYDPLKYQIGLQQAVANSGISMDTVQKISPMLQQAVQNATENNTKSKFSQFVPSLISGSPTQQKQALVNMYLTDPKRMPYEVMKDLINNNIKTVDSGNQLMMYRTDSYNNFIDKDNNGNPVSYFTIDKQASPDTALKVGEQRYEYTNPSANTLVQLQEKRYEHDNASGNARLQAQTQMYTHQTPSGSVIYQASTPGKNADVNKIKAMEQYLNLKYKYDPTGMEKDPVYQAYVSAIQGVSGGGSQQGSGDGIVSWIQQVKDAGASKDQVLKALHDKGYGNAYDSYVW